MKPCLHMKADCIDENPQDTQRCISCLAVSIINGADLLFNSVKSCKMPLIESYAAIDAMHQMMNSKMALFNLLRVKSDEQTKLEMSSILETGVV